MGRAMTHKDEQALFDERHAPRPRTAVLRALEASKRVRTLLREDGAAHHHVHAALLEGLKAGPLVIR
jgi:hypothetical protein